MNEQGTPKTTKQCKYCRSEIDAAARICPICKKKQNANGCLVAILIVVSIFVIGVIATRSGSNSNTTSQENGQVAQNTAPQIATESSSVNNTENTEKSNDAVPSEYKLALRKAKLYSDNMYMSKAGIYDQLTSEYGEKFTSEAAQYAIDNVEADWNKNALEKAKIYQENMSMSPAAIRDQLTSEYGEKFTEEEAEYAISHLE